MFCHMGVLGNQERFLQANQAVAQGDYQGALRLYDSIKNPGPAVWYNKGNCLCVLKQYVDALVCWRRSQQCGDPLLYAKAEHACEMIKKQHGDQESTGLFLRIVWWLTYASMYGSLLLWQCLFLIGWSMFIMLMPRMIRKRSFVFLAFFIVVMILLGVMCGRRFSVMTKQYGIVKKDSSLYIGSDERFSSCGFVRPLHEVRIVEKKGKWYKVFRDDVCGWISADAVIPV